MSTQFYTRYVPPTTTDSGTAPDTPKRKRAVDDASPIATDETAEKKKPKKRKSEDDGAAAVKEQKKKEKKAKKEADALRAAEVAKAAAEEAEGAAKELRRKEKKAKKAAAEAAQVDTESTEKPKEKKRKSEDVDSTPKKEKKERKSKKSDTTTEQTAAADSTTVPKKAAKPSPADADEVGSGALNILKKLRKSLKRTAAAAAAPEPAPAPTPEIPEPEGLAPVGLQHLPQPAQAPASKPVSAFSSLPTWLQEPVSVPPSTTIPFASVPNISPKLLTRLESQSITSAFAVQTAVLPLLLQPCSSDLLISAATGSGKTLAYVLPIIQSLSTRIVTRLRAIIVVPTRELVQQVHATTTALSTTTGLKCGTAIGSRSLSTEQSLLLDPPTATSPAESKIDILITTPGRLVEHVASTPGFDLSFVQYLVIDEADRLLAQSFQEWVDIVIGGLHRALQSRESTHVAGYPVANLGLRPVRRTVQKIVLSATMTRDVGKLADLRLRNPKLIVVEDPPLPVEAGAALDGDAAPTNELAEQFSVPAKLREYVCSVENLEQKPLVLLYLLVKQAMRTGVLVFVKSNEGAARLAKLLGAVSKRSENESQKWRIELVTGEMEKKRREKVLKRFARGEVDV